MTVWNMSEEKQLLLYGSYSNYWLLSHVVSTIRYCWQLDPAWITSCSLDLSMDYTIMCLQKKPWYHLFIIVFILSSDCDQIMVQYLPTTESKVSNPFISYLPCLTDFVNEHFLTGKRLYWGHSWVSKWAAILLTGPNASWGYMEQGP